MSKTKALVGGKTLSLWIPDEEWVDDFNHLLSKRTKTDRSLTRNSLFLHCVEVGLQHLDDKQDSDSIRIHLDSFPEEQAELLRSPAGKKMVTNLIMAMLAGQLTPVQIQVPEVAATIEPEPAEEELPEPVFDPVIEEPVAAPEPVPEPEPVPPAPKPPERKIPDLFHTLMRNTSLG